MAVSEDGKAEAGMGIDAADIDGNGWLDVFITHLDLGACASLSESRQGSLRGRHFRGQTRVRHFPVQRLRRLFIDYDNDGARDIFMANGHILDNIELYHAETRYAEPKLIYRNNGRGIFRERE